MLGLERFFGKKPQMAERPQTPQVPYLDEKRDFEEGVCGHNKYDLENAVALGKIQRGDTINLVIGGKPGQLDQILCGREYGGFVKSTDGNAVRHTFCFTGNDGEKKFEQFSWQIKGWKKIEVTKESDVLGSI